MVVITSSRRQLIDANTTPFYHIVTRYVRRAFLCGEDKLTGCGYEHQRDWIVDKIKALSAAGDKSLKAMLSPLSI